MSMVSYYSPAAMYRHPHQAAAAAAAQTGAAAAFHHHAAANGMHPHSWYPTGGYHHQSGAQATPPASSYCMQDEQQMWHTQHAHSAAAAVAAAAAYHADFGNHEFTHGMTGMQHHHQQLELPENQLPSPPITVSGSELSSPGGTGGSVTPPNPTGKSRPVPARSPYDWMTKPSYQSQPNPGKTRTKDKYRVVYTDNQRVELEKEFYYSRYITIRRKTELATNLGLSERQVKIWFQNRRAKERKQGKKRDELAPDESAVAPMSGKSHLIQLSNHDLQHHFAYTEMSANGLMVDSQYSSTLNQDNSLHTGITGIYNSQESEPILAHASHLEPSQDTASEMKIDELESDAEDD